MRMSNTSFVKETELSFALACCHEYTGLVGEEWIGMDLAFSMEYHIFKANAAASP